MKEATYILYPGGVKFKTVDELMEFYRSLGPYPAQEYSISRVCEGPQCTYETEEFEMTQSEKAKVYVCPHCTDEALEKQANAFAEINRAFNIIV